MDIEDNIEDTILYGLTDENNSARFVTHESLRVSKGKMEYNESYKKMDPEIIPLCDVINSISGLVTVGSCCGHGKADIFVSVASDNLENYRILIENLHFFYHRDNRIVESLFKLEILYGESVCPPISKNMYVTLLLKQGKIWVIIFQNLLKFLSLS